MTCVLRPPTLQRFKTSELAAIAWRALAEIESLRRTAIIEVQPNRGSKAQGNV